MNTNKTVIGIDLGGSNSRAAVYKQGRLLPMLTTDTPETCTPNAIIEALATLCERALAEAGLDSAEAVGVGVPGAINPYTHLTWAPNLGWKDVPFEALLSEATGMRVFCGNDANVAALAEAVEGKGAGYTSMLMVTLGTGIGGGLIDHGRIRRGAHGWFGEIGHTTIIMDGLECSCGRKGCFEMYASARAMRAQAEEAARINPDSMLAQREPKPRWLETCARAGDPVSLEVWNRYTDYLATGLSSVSAVLDPGCIVLGGGVSGAGDFLLEPLKARMEALKLTPDAPEIPVFIAECGGEAGVLGAAINAVNNL